MKKNNRMTGRALSLISFVLVVFLLAACSEQTNEIEGLRITPVFGPDSFDISTDVDWFSTKIGTIESDQRDDAGVLIGFDWKSKFDSLGQDGVYPIVDGEVGVKLSLRGLTHYSKHTLSSGAGQSQTLEIAINQFPRFVLNAEGLSDDTLTELKIDGVKFGTSTSTTGWRNQKGAHYLKSTGRYTISLTNDVTKESLQQDIVVGEGDSAAILFTFTK